MKNQQQGATQFIDLVYATFESAASLTSVQFTVSPIAGSVTRPISATYSASYMVAHGYWDGSSVRVQIPVFGLYAGRSNSYTLTFTFSDGSTVQHAENFTTAPYTDSCNVLNRKTVIVPRSSQTNDISYDFVMLKKYCDDTSPVLMDTDGNVRWIGTGSTEAHSSIFLNNKFYVAAANSSVISMDFDGSTQNIGSYTGIGLTTVNHHNFDPGRTGIVMDVDTTTETEGVDVEIDTSGNVLNTWDLGKIISAAMTAGGDDPSQFVYYHGQGWFHNNSTTYNPADNTLIVSSRENFVIALDYDTQAIKWILGDPTKKWYGFPSLRKYALALSPGTIPPAGQHAVSIRPNGDLLLFDNGSHSYKQKPEGADRHYSAPRSYHIDTTTMTATEGFTYDPANDKRDSRICSSVYEDPGAPENFLMDYSYEKAGTVIEVLGLSPSGKVVFDYKFPNVHDCKASWNAQIIHLENLQF